MEQFNFYLKGQLVEPPENWDGMSIQLNFDRDKNQVTQQVTLTNLAWVLQNNDVMIDHLNKGKTLQGPGVFEGIPFDISVSSPGQPETFFFRGYVDTSGTAVFSNNIRTTADIKEKDSVDILNDVVDGVTYDYLYALAAGAPGKISASDFVFVPYILNSIPDYPQAMLGLLSAYVMADQISSSIESMTELAVEMANPFEATAIVRAVLRVAYLILLIIAIIKLVKDTIALIIQPVKYHATMPLLKLLQRGAEALGYTFKCPILETGAIDGVPLSKLHIMPDKQFVDINDTDDRILGFTAPNQNEQAGYWKGTFGELLRATKAMIRGKVQFLPNKEMWLVREDESVGAPTYQLPDVRQDYYTLNTDEFRANYEVKFQYDVIEKNTVQQFLGTICQVITRPIQVTNPDMVLMRGFERVELPFALAKRKETLTVPEKIVDGFLDVFDAIINALISAVNAVINVYNEVVKVLNKIIDALDIIGIDVGWEIPSIPPLQPVSLGTLIENRIGMLLLETDQTSKPKIMLLDVSQTPKFTKLNAANATVLTARKLYDNFHFVTSFVPNPAAGKPNGNQWVKKELLNVPGFGLAHYNQIKFNNKIFDHAGNEAEIDSLLWKVRSQSADINVRFSELYTKNLQNTILEPDGK